MLLASAEYGRVAWCHEGEVMIAPVNSRVDDGRIVFHAVTGSRLSDLNVGTRITFQTDEVDIEDAVGWSVLAQGRLIDAGGEIGPVTWREAEDAIGFGIEIERISGRVLSGTKREES